MVPRPCKVLTAGSASVTFSALLLAVAAAVELRSWEEAERMADNTLVTMTPYERHMLMRGTGWTPNPAGINLFPILSPGMYMGNTPGIPRLGIPPLKLHDAGNGFRNNPMGSASAFGTSTSFPSALALAAAWDDGLMRRTAKAIGEEFRAKGANVILGPGIQVHRVARNGRNFEYMSGDDPYLGARLAAAYVEAVQATGVIACAKHWAFNEQETNRMEENSEVDEKTAWEIYYPPFEAAVKAGVGSFMCGYNKVHGAWACENTKLLKRDLKEKMGFKGFVMSDWFATHSPSVLQGLDQSMPGVEGYFSHEALECMETGKGCEQFTREKTKLEEVWEAVSGVLMPKDPNVPDPPGTPRDFNYGDAARRILAAIYHNRVDELPGCSPGPDCIASLAAPVRNTMHDTVAEEGATQSVVLLKNLGALPIDPKHVRKIALVGAISSDAVHEQPEGMPPADYLSGGGSGHTSANGWDIVRADTAIARRAKQDGIEVMAQNVFGDFDNERFFKIINEADLNIYIAATTATEGQDRNQLFLDMYANEMIGYMAEAGPTVVLMQTPGVVVLPWRNHENVSAIMNLFLAGEKTGVAWANTLFGDVSPSGKLPVLFPKTHALTVQPTQGLHIPYSEGMFGSYRSPQVEAMTAYPFGHGLSYTTFAYGRPEQVPLSECERAERAWSGSSPLKACVAVLVSNSGRRSGAEVAQAYVEFPKATGMPRLMLKGFHKTAVLAPGASEPTRFALTARDLSTYQEHTSSWELHQSVTLHVGASSADLRGSLTVTAGDLLKKPAIKEEL